MTLKQEQIVIIFESESLYYQEIWLSGIAGDGECYSFYPNYVVYGEYKNHKKNGINKCYLVSDSGEKLIRVSHYEMDRKTGKEIKYKNGKKYVYTY